MKKRHPTWGAYIFIFMKGTFQSSNLMNCQKSSKQPWIHSPPHFCIIVLQIFGEICNIIFWIRNYSSLFLIFSRNLFVLPRGGFPKRDLSTPTESTTEDNFFSRGRYQNNNLVIRLPTSMLHRYERNQCRSKQ